MKNKIAELLSNKYEDYCKGVEIPYGVSIKILLEMIIQKSGIEDEYIHVNISDNKKLNEILRFSKDVTYMRMLKEICMNHQLDIYLDDNGIFIMA